MSNKECRISRYYPKRQFAICILQFAFCNDRDYGYRRINYRAESRQARSSMETFPIPLAATSSLEDQSQHGQREYAGGSRFRDKHLQIAGIAGQLVGQ